MNKQKLSDEKRNVNDYCDRFSSLKVYKTKQRGDALNKPILLLSVITLIEQKVIEDKYIYIISDELIECFKKYWRIIVGRDFLARDFVLPFFHLKNEQPKFWYLEYSQEYDGGRPESIPKLRRDVNRAYIDDELFNLINNPITRQELIDALVGYWFPENENLEEVLKINNQWDEIEEKIKLDEVPNNQVKFQKTTSLVRDAFFRKSIIYTYECRCCFCGLKINHKYSNIIDAAHIKPLAKFYDNRINNGIALCKNHHWAFDIGLFSINENYRIIVANNFEEDSPQAKSIKSFDGSPIILPHQSKYYPMLQSLQWHRENVFIGKY